MSQKAFETWNPDSHSCCAEMGLVDLTGYKWHPEQDCGDGGSSYFQLFQLEPWKKILSIYPHWVSALRRGFYCFDGVKVMDNESLEIIGHAKTISEAGAMANDYVKCASKK